jgi:hypothetical protein
LIPPFFSLDDPTSLFSLMAMVERLMLVDEEPRGMVYMALYPEGSRYRSRGLCAQLLRRCVCYRENREDDRADVVGSIGEWQQS